MLIYILIMLCIAFTLLHSWCNSKSVKLPLYPGALPLIGHTHLFIGDNTKLWEFIQKISMECVKQGGAINASVGPFLYPVLADPDDCGIVMNSSLDKHYIYTNILKDWGAEGVLLVDATLWTKHRKLLNPIFTQQVLNGFLDLFNKQAKRLVSQLAAEEGKGPFNHEQYIYLIGLETIYQSALGLDLDSQVGIKEYLRALSYIMELSIERFRKIWLQNDFIFNWSSLKKKQDENLKVVHDMTNTVLERRKEVLKQKNDKDNGEFKPFIDRILNVTMEKENFRDIEIRDELNTIIAAGYDTSAEALVYVLMILGSYPSVQDRVYEELIEVLGTSRDTEKQDLTRLVYMEAVLKETLRLYPVAPILPRLNKREVKLKNCTLPAGSNCFISVYGLHRHPVWGPDAEEFRPERWLDPASLPDNPNAYGGFGLGRRACIGKTFAMMSMKTTLAHVLRRYRVFADITKLKCKFELLLKSASGQHIIIERRT